MSSGINLDLLSGASPQLIAMLKEKIAEAERLQRERDACPAPTTPPTASELATADRLEKLRLAEKKAVLVSAASVVTASSLSDSASECTSSAAATWLDDVGSVDAMEIEGVYVKDGKYFKDGEEVSAKWLKRMRQKLRDSKGGASSSCAAAVPNVVASVKQNQKKPRNHEPVKAGTAAAAGANASAAAAPGLDVKTMTVIAEAAEAAASAAEALLEGRRATTAAATTTVAVVREIREGWPRVKCATCPATDHWRRMKEVINVQVFHEKKGDPEDVRQTVYFCAGCVAKAGGLTVPQAQAEIQLTRYNMLKRTARQAEYNHAKQHVLEEFPSMARDKACKLSRMRLSEVLQPLALHLARKERAVQMRGQLVGRHRELAEKLALTADRRECDALLDQIEALEDEIDAATAPIAFSNRVLNTMVTATDEERRVRQWEFMLAAQYSDLWCEIKDRRGRRVGAMMSYYVCLAGGSAYPCGTVMESHAWDRLHSNPLQQKQRWYCNVCSAKYKTKYGVLVQVLLPPCDAHPEGSVQWMRAEVPDTDHEDVRAMYLEAEFDPASPEELYGKVTKNASPSTTDGMLRVVHPYELSDKCKGAVGTFKIVPIAEFLSMGLFPWDQIFNMSK